MCGKYCLESSILLCYQYRNNVAKSFVGMRSKQQVKIAGFVAQFVLMFSMFDAAMNIATHQYY